MAIGRHKLAAGQTRSCPHCRATILESAAVCPACRHHLRFAKAGAAEVTEPADVALCISGNFRADPAAGRREFSVVLTLTDEQGREIARQVIGVGGLAPGEGRTVELRVEVSPGSGA